MFDKLNKWSKKLTGLPLIEDKPPPLKVVVFECVECNSRVPRQEGTHYTGYHGLSIALAKKGKCIYCGLLEICPGTMKEKT